MEQVLRLPVADRAELMYELADSLANEEPLSQELQALADQRLVDLKTSPDAHRPWEEVRAELFGEYLS